MRFSIVTPSFRSAPWLRLCIPSVADQGPEVLREHIVQDACSDDGTGDWLPADPRVKAFIEKDRGMYDAVNRGYRRATGEFVAYLNCDEQYLPGALARVARAFDEHPEVDVWLGDCLVVDAGGGYRCFRRALPPTLWHTRVSGNLSFLTAGTFVRRRALEERGLWFDETRRDISDVLWALQLIGKGIRVGRLAEFTSVFTDTGDNMNLKENARSEWQTLVASCPAWLRLLRPAVIAAYRLRRWRHGAYRCAPHDYAIYTRESPERRRTFRVDRPNPFWERIQLSA